MATTKTLRRIAGPTTLPNGVVITPVDWGAVAACPGGHSLGYYDRDDKIAVATLRSATETVMDDVFPGGRILGDWVDHLTEHGAAMCHCTAPDADEFAAAFAKAADEQPGTVCWVED
jgi:hypothetical protein